MDENVPCRLIPEPLPPASKLLAPPNCAHTSHSRIALEAGPGAMRDRRDCMEEPERLDKQEAKSENGPLPLDSLVLGLQA